MKQISNESNTPGCNKGVKGNEEMACYFNSSSKTALILFVVSSRGVIPYAISSPNWIEDSIARHRHGYETLDDENVPTASRQPFYINVTPNGSLDLPPYLRDIVFEFEQLYENTKYKRLHRYV